MSPRDKESSDAALRSALVSLRVCKWESHFNITNSFFSRPPSSISFILSSELVLDREKLS
jgi:hypothetical protein